MNGVPWQKRMGGVAHAVIWGPFALAHRADGTLEGNGPIPRGAVVCALGARVDATAACLATEQAKRGQLRVE